MNMIKLQFLMSATIALAGFAAAAEAQSVDGLLKRYSEQSWRRDVDGPVLSLGQAGAFDDTHLLSPCVARLDGKYFLWYVGSRGNVADRVFRVGLAVSDDGRTFRRHETNPVLQFPDGRHSIVTPTLLAENNGTPIREQGKLRMWFSGVDFHDPKQLHTLHEATSDDGIAWSVPSEPQLENVYAPTILKEEDLYHLWYTDVAAKSWNFRHATSPDGRKWEVDAEPVMVVDQSWESSRLFYPTVRKVDGGYVMWYGSYWRGQTAKTALGVAVSVDGRTWKKAENNPIFRPDESRTWESHYTTSQSLMQLDDGSWRIWYASRTKPPFVHKYFAIGTALWPAAANR